MPATDNPSALLATVRMHARAVQYLLYVSGASCLSICCISRAIIAMHPSPQRQLTAP